MEETINQILLKPRFKIYLDQDAETLLAHLKEQLEKKDCAFEGTISNDHLFIDIPKHRQQVWSPHLEMVVEKAEKGSLVRGFFGPQPGIWTFFIFLHFVTAISFFIFFALAYANHVTHHKTGIWLSLMGLMVFVWIFLYFLGHMGKIKAKNQMKELRTFLKKNIE